MIIHDRIYGRHTVDSPVLIELIHSRPVQRLKNISQIGIPPQYYFMKSDNRFQHSLGVMLLLKVLGASEEEQIAGLLHDISHTAFSHVIDWVVGSGATEDYQDKQHASIMRSPEIMDILNNFGYDINRISRHTAYPLLDREIPDLCADRIDYALREFPPAVAARLWKKLAVVDGKIIFADRLSARQFALNFLRRQQRHWGGFEAVSRYHYFAEVLKVALREGLIVFADFMRDEPFILGKLDMVTDSRAVKILETLGKKSLAGFPKSKRKYRKKLRYVDPLFLFRGGLQRLSSVDRNFVRLVAEERKNNRLGISIAVI